MCDNVNRRLSNASHFLFSSPPGPESRFKPAHPKVGAFFSVSLSLLLLLLLSLPSISVFLALSLLISPRPFLLLSSFPSPLKVKCTREETSPDREGSDPSRAAPRETHLRMLMRAHAVRFFFFRTFPIIGSIATRSRLPPSRKRDSATGSPTCCCSLLPAFPLQAYLRHVLQASSLHSVMSRYDVFFFSLFPFLSRRMSRRNLYGVHLLTARERHSARPPVVAAEKHSDPPVKIHDLIITNSRYIGTPRAIQTLHRNANGGRIAMPDAQEHASRCVYAHAQVPRVYFLASQYRSDPILPNELVTETLERQRFTASRITLRVRALVGLAVSLAEIVRKFTRSRCSSSPIAESNSRAQQVR